MGLETLWTPFLFFPMRRIGRIKVRSDQKQIHAPRYADIKGSKICNKDGMHREALLMGRKCPAIRWRRLCRFPKGR